MVSGSWPCVFFDVLGVFRVGSFQIIRVLYVVFDIFFRSPGGSWFLCNEKFRKIDYSCKNELRSQPRIDSDFRKVPFAFSAGGVPPDFRFYLCRLAWLLGFSVLKNPGSMGRG